MGLPGHGRADEHGAVEVTNSGGGQPARPLGGEGRLGRGVVDDDRGRIEGFAALADHGVHDGVVFEDEVDPFGAPHRVGGAGGEAGPNGFERLGFAWGPVPDGDGVAAGHGGFDEGAAEQAGSQESDSGHQRAPRKWCIESFQVVMIRPISLPGSILISICQSSGWNVGERGLGIALPGYEPQQRSPKC